MEFTPQLGDTQTDQVHMCQVPEGKAGRQCLLLPAVRADSDKVILCRGGEESASSRNLGRGRGRQRERQVTGSQGRGEEQAEKGRVRPRVRRASPGRKSSSECGEGAEGQGGQQVAAAITCVWHEAGSGRGGGQILDLRQNCQDLLMDWVWRVRERG